MAFVFFDHQGSLKTNHLANGETVPSPVKTLLRLRISELFEIHGGRIDQIEAVLDSVPHGMTSAVCDEPDAEEPPDYVLRPGHLASGSPRPVRHVKQWHASISKPAAQLRQAPIVILKLTPGNRG